MNVITILNFIKKKQYFLLQISKVKSSVLVFKIVLSDKYIFEVASNTKACFENCNYNKNTSIITIIFVFENKFKLELLSQLIFCIIIIKYL